MKSIRQQLQSRISKRRNFIAYVENQKESRRETIKAVADFIDVADMKANLAQIKVELKALHADQKLDKKLYVMLLAEERESVYWKEFAASIPSADNPSLVEYL